jgi:hypothetical protein
MTTTRRPVDIVTLIALGGLIASWFWLTMLSTDLGSVELRFRFYDLWALINRPGLLLTGIGERNSLGTVAFGVLCVAAAISPLLPLVRDTTATRLAGSIPLLWMLGFGGWLYWETLGHYFTHRASADSLVGQLTHWANSLTNDLLERLAGRVSFGAGAWLGFVASAFLAQRSVRSALARR